MTAAEPLPEPTLTLERCICGRCRYCPDGYHWKPEELPCSCTPDCVEMCEVGMTGVDECWHCQDEEA